MNNTVFFAKYLLRLLCEQDLGLGVIIAGILWYLLVFMQPLWYTSVGKWIFQEAHAVDHEQQIDQLIYY